MRFDSKPAMPGMFRFRRRKQISIDGHTPGLEYQRGRRGYSPMPVTGHVTQVNRDEYDALEHAESYDPERRFYLTEDSGYRRASPWHDAPFSQTPPLRFPTSTVDSDQIGPEIDSDLAGWLIRRFVNDAADRRSNLQTPHDRTIDNCAQSDANDTLRIKIADLHRIAAMQAYEQSVFMSDVVDSFSRHRQIKDALDTINYFFGGPEDVSQPDYSSLTADDMRLLNETIQTIAEEMGAIPGESLDPNDLAVLSGFAVGPDLHSLTESARDEIDSQMDSLLGVTRAQSFNALEQIVEDEMARMQAHGMMDPFSVANPYAMPPGFAGPGMPMDPFDPMPPGL